MKKLEWNTNNNADYFTRKGDVAFCIDKNSLKEGYSVRIVGMSSTVEFYGDIIPFKTLKKAQDFCKKKLVEYIEELKKIITELEK